MDTAEAAQQAADIALLQKAISDHIFVAQMTTSVKMLIEFLQQNPAAMSSKQAVLNAVVEAKLFSNRQQPGRAWNTIIREYRKSQRASINKTVGVTLEQGWNVEWEPSDEPGGPDVSNSLATSRCQFWFWSLWPWPWDTWTPFSASLRPTMLMTSLAWPY